MNIKKKTDLFKQFKFQKKKWKNWISAIFSLFMNLRECFMAFLFDKEIDW